MSTAVKRSDIRVPPSSRFPGRVFLPTRSKGFVG
jgi:hypothetical protein